LSDEFLEKTLVSIDHILELYDKLKVMEAQGGEEKIFRGVLSDIRDELNRLPNLVALLGNLQAAQILKARSRNTIYWINFIMGTQSVNAKKASTLLLGSGELSELLAELEALRDMLKHIQSTRRFKVRAGED
jgi:hypothetical protein